MNAFAVRGADIVIRMVCSATRMAIPALSEFVRDVNMPYVWHIWSRVW